MYKVSVIIPVYNGGNRVAEAIKSVLKQTYPNFELIVVDDGSRDNTSAVVRSIQDERVMLLRHPNNRGICAARNTALAAASGEYIAFLDDDDIWEPTKLERQIELFRNNSNLGLIHTCAIDIYDNGMVLRRCSYYEGNCYRKLLIRDGIIASSAIVPRYCFERVGYFDEDLRLYGDWDVWIKIAKDYQIGLVKEPLVRTRIRAGSLQHSEVSRCEMYRKRVLDKHWEEIERLGLRNKAYAWHYYSIGVQHLWKGEILEARKAFTRSLRYEINLDCLAYLLCSFMPYRYRFWLRYLSRRFRCWSGGVWVGGLGR
ncbi:MAG: glycosyltransferase [Candidatus Methanomethyliaceae archaeon]